MARLLSHPFRLTPDGSVAVVDDDSEAAVIEGVAVLALTRRGERTLVPLFGVTDPTFKAANMSRAELNLGLTDFGPAVQVADLTVTYPRDDTARIVVTLED